MCRLFLVFVTKLAEVPFLRGFVSQIHESEKIEQTPTTFSEDSDLDLCLYYLQTFSNILTYAGDISWVVLASKHITFNGQQMQISCKKQFTKPNETVS